MTHMQYRCALDQFRKSLNNEYCQSARAAATTQSFLGKVVDMIALWVPCATRWSTRDAAIEYNKKTRARISGDFTILHIEQFICVLNVEPLEMMNVYAHDSMVAITAYTQSMHLDPICSAHMQNTFQIYLSIELSRVVSIACIPHIMLQFYYCPQTKV